MGFKTDKIWVPMEKIESSLLCAPLFKTYRNMFGPDVLEAIERALMRS
ncbi:MAG: hypothetical protein CM15mV33_900 [uncultured marine virus]|nr:MAG: hypothetical protein CM15mV33_900 [uncultured marine virus]